MTETIIHRDTQREARETERNRYRPTAPRFLISFQTLGNAQLQLVAVAEKDLCIQEKTMSIPHMYIYIYIYISAAHISTYILYIHIPVYITHLQIREQRVDSSRRLVSTDQGDHIPTSTHAQTTAERESQ